MTTNPRSPSDGIDAGRLWAGGAATALVAALVAVVGILIARGLLDIAVLAPKGEGAWGNASTPTYAVVSAGAALLATALMHVLQLSTPSATTFFGWIMVLLTIAAAVMPLTIVTNVSPKIATAVINVAIGLTIAVLVAGVASTARTRARPRTNRDDYRDDNRTGYRDDYGGSGQTRTQYYDY